ncbi:MAG: HXXEE domain-containing protein [Acidobacteriaceae bacterium]|nr:HXXEE domain-containing protein [Acidobacteriaceae bacterium]
MGHYHFERLQWMFPLAVTLHNLEEAIWLPSWAAGHNTELSWQVTAVHFRLALVFLTVAAYLVTWLSRKHGEQSRWTYLFVAYTFVMFLNVFVPHVPATVLFHGYTPGMVTAVIVNLPVTTTLLALAVQERVIPSLGIATLVFGIPLAIALSAAALFAARLHFTAVH